MLDSIRKYMEIEWVRYLMYIGGLTALFFIAAKIFSNRRRRKNGKKIKEEPLAIAVDDTDCYVVSKGGVTRYHTKTHRRDARGKFSLKNVTDAKIVGNDLVVLTAGVMLVFDLYDLKPKAAERISEDLEDVTCFEKKWGLWWVCHRVLGKAVVSCFDDNWNMSGFWRLPKSVSKDLQCAWFGENFAILDNESGALYVLDLDSDSVDAEILRKESVKNVDGCNPTDLTREEEVWGVDDANRIVRLVQ